MEAHARRASLRRRRQLRAPHQLCTGTRHPGNATKRRAVARASIFECRVVGFHVLLVPRLFAACGVGIGGASCAPATATALAWRRHSRCSAADSSPPDESSCGAVHIDGVGAIRPWRYDDLQRDDPLVGNRRALAERHALERQLVVAAAHAGRRPVPAPRKPAAGKSARPCMRWSESHGISPSEIVAWYTWSGLERRSPSSGCPVLFPRPGAVAPAGVKSCQ